MKPRHIFAVILSAMLLYALSIGPVVAYQIVRTRKFPLELTATYYRPLLWLAPLGTSQNNALSHYTGFWVSIFVRASVPQNVSTAENSN